MPWTGKKTSPQHGNEIQATTIAFVIISGVAIALRFRTKANLKIGIGSDDWWILIGYAFFVIEQGLQYHAFHIALDHPSDTLHFQKYLLIAAMFSFIPTTAIRIGILSYYRRIFPIPSFRRLSMLFIITCVLYCVPATIAEIFACTPVAAIWDPAIAGNCITYTLFYVIILSIEIVLDACILLLPLREVHRLQMAPRKKILVSLIFLLGGFSIVTNMVRVIVADTSDPDRLNEEADCLYFNIHVGTAFLCACLPTYRPLLLTAIDFSQEFWSRLTSGRLSKGTSNDVKENHSIPKTLSAEHRRSPYQDLEEDYREECDLVIAKPKSTAQIYSLESGDGRSANDEHL